MGFFFSHRYSNGHLTGLAVKLDAEGDLWIGELILVQRHDASRPQEIIPASPGG
ncbi:MAG: hypothetical protein IKO65_02005 [Victivallales bacterium]|nr:hypothetical protein [Victivallales bacterium]